jgi:hypothetical protein
MVVLLRASGIPARLVTGFGPGERNPFTGYFEVRESDAHAWVEVLYPGVGWVPYDPTFGVPPAAPGLVGRFIAPEVIGAIGRFFSRVVPEPLKAGIGELGSAIAAAARAALAVWPIALALVLLVGIALLISGRRRRERRRGPPPSGAAAAFVALSAALGARGHPRASHQTPSEYLHGIERARLLPEPSLADAELVVRTFERERFSDEPPAEEEVAAARAAVDRVRKLTPAAR